MKSLLIATMLATQPATDLNEPFNWTEYCTFIGDMAQGFMEANQRNIALSDVMGMIVETTPPEEDPEGALRRVMRSMAMDAYERAPMQTESNAERQRAQFRNMWELACWENEGER